MVRVHGVILLYLYKTTVAVGIAMIMKDVLFTEDKPWTSSSG